MSEPKTPESETPTQNLSARDIAALLLVGVGVVVAIAVNARGVATFLAWLAIFSGIIAGLSTKSAVIRFGGAFIVSLVVVTAIAVVVRSGDRDSPQKSDAFPKVRGVSGPATARAGPPSKSAPGRSADEVARKLGGGSKEAAGISRIAAFHDVTPDIVGDQAAKAASLCLGSEDAASKPAEAMRFASASLLFVDKTTRDAARELDAKSVRKILPLTEAFVTYVASGCPTQE